MYPSEGEFRELTAAQLGVWYAQQFGPDNPVYNVGGYLEITGPLDMGLFEAALRQTVDETDALHLHILIEDQRPRQYIRKPTDWSLRVIDVSSAVRPRAAAVDWMHADMLRPFDLLAGPLFSQAVFKLGPDRFLWYLRVHHIAVDGPSSSAIAARAAELYTALLAKHVPVSGGMDSVLSLIDAHLAYRKSPAFERDREFWSRILSGFPEAVSASGARVLPQPQVPVRHVDDIQLACGIDLDAIASRLRTSVAGLTVTAAAIYLGRSTGTEDVVLGLYVLGRAGRRARRIPGMTSNILPIRLRVNLESTVGEISEQVKARIQEALRHQLYRNEDIVRDLKLVDIRSLLSLTVNIVTFDHEFRFGQNLAVEHNLASGPISDTRVLAYRSSADGGIQVAFDTNPSLYAGEFSSSLAARFGRILNWFETASLSDRIGEIDVLDQDERQRILTYWNDTTRDVPPATLVGLFAAQAARTPDAIAVTCAGEQLTYAGLDAASSRLARLLIGRGAGPESVVAVMMERSAGLACALLAVLKAGAAYLPVDPAYPADRAGFMLADAGPVCVLADPEASAALNGAAGGVPVIVPEDPGTQAVLAGLSGRRVTDADRAGPVLPDHRAYVIYTSGSTGTPKGVAVSHGSVAGLLGGTWEEYRFGQTDVWTLFHSFAFDFSVWEMWGALLHGGRLVVVPSAVRRSPGDFLGLLARSRSRVLCQTPSAFYQLDQADAARPEMRLALRQVIFGGEALDPARVQGWSGSPPGRRRW